MRLDELMPEWKFAEHHRTTVDAPAAAVLDAMEAVTWREVPLFRALMTVRALGNSRWGVDSRILETMEATGFHPLGRTEDEYLVGLIGRMWVPGGGLRRFSGTEEFIAFDEPGWAKTAFNFHVVGDQLTTTTRTMTTSRSAELAFGSYWAVIRPFSGITRRSWLQAIRRRVEAGETAKVPPDNADERR